ncbi:Flp family type IVb pilin [Sphingomonas sp. CFBP 13733]|uniref:Flp family type IVb pilin n=1 Tax=Sphingomonas sp. CFBP 13733 TaxID=2775291 RepID=UPI001358300C|nr:MULTISPECIES: Flp family type IVb pilin [unclassified Sphingomonas]MBD8640715.1 Flp family type IVb pilin [Sphingomonas sp. CFBP 13733]
MRRKIRAAAAALITDRRGATAVEYGLILALVVLGMIAGLVYLADGTTALWSMLHNRVANAR